MSVDSDKYDAARSLKDRLTAMAGIPKKEKKEPVV
jgi:hypothetical protein